MFFRPTESTDIPQFDGHRFRLISGLSLIGSMMDQSATVKSTRSDTLIRTNLWNPRPGASATECKQTKILKSVGLNRPSECGMAVARMHQVEEVLRPVTSSLVRF